jgi:hypothetical protein
MSVSVSNDGYFCVQYQNTSNSTANATSYSLNPWTSTSSTTAILPTTTTNGTSTTQGTWVYYCVDFIELNWAISSYWLPGNTSESIPSEAVELTNSYLYVYTLGSGGTSSNGCGGGGTGGLAGGCFNPTWGISAVFNNTNSAVGGADYTQTNNDGEPPSTTNPGPTSTNFYAGNGSSSSSSSSSSSIDGGNGSVVLPSTNVDDISSTTPGSYILPPTGSVTAQAVSSNIGFCIGGVGGQPASGSNYGTSTTALPEGSPNWVSSQTTTTGVYQIMLADGTYFSMPASPAGTSAQAGSVLFAIFTPTPTSTS